MLIDARTTYEKLRVFEIGNVQLAGRIDLTRCGRREPIAEQAESPMACNRLEP
jgi:hypothetical protein